MIRILSGVALGWAIAFAICLAYWAWSEGLQPGQQYADPLWPCVYCGWALGAVPGYVAAVLHATYRRRRA